MINKFSEIERQNELARKVLTYRMILEELADIDDIMIAAVNGDLYKIQDKAREATGVR